MNLKLNILTILSLTGIINSLFLATLVFFKKSRNKFSNRYLSLILVLIAIKIGYASLEQQLWDEPIMYLLYTKMAVTAYLCLIPLFILYIDSLLKKDFIPDKKQLILFLPAFLYIINPYENFFWINKGFYLIQACFIIFTILSTFKIAKILKRKKENPSPANLKIINWLIIIQSGLLVVWGTAFGAFIYELSALYAIVLYLLIKIGPGDIKTINNGWQFRETDTQHPVIEKLKSLMVSEKLFLDSSITLPRLADKLSVSLHILSREINNHCNQNFTEYINSFRIEEACRMLSSDLYAHLTIESIAYDCGFNSLSSFNAAFKKIMNVTPSQYKLSTRKNYSISYN